MKTKPLFILLVVFVLSGAASTNALLTAADNAAIKDIEYLTGDDFVQLHFKIDKMIPIPDVFYPEKDNTNLLVMRLRDVPFDLSKDRFIFNSNVIDYVEIIGGKNAPEVYVRIHLKQQVNYRVFTNQKGLYIEFPNLQPVGAEAKPAPKLLAVDKNNQPPAPKPTPPVTSAPTPADNKGGTEIKDIVLSEKDADHIKFEILVTGTADFNVIPIPQEPARLAIDFKDTRSKQIKKSINHLNVKGIRGGYNSASVYRVVFDLLYLKNYKVSPVYRNGNIVEVEFSNIEIDNAPKSVNKNEPTQATQATPPPITVKKEAEKDNTGNPAIGNPASISIKNEDFFEDEKSQVTVKEKTPEKTPEKSPATETPPAPSESADDVSQITYLKKTINEGEKVYTGDRMTFNFHNGDLKDVIKIIAKMAGKNIVMDPGVTGRVTSQLTDVPWDQALELFLKTNGLSYVEEGNIMRIARVDVLAKEAEELRRLRDAKQMEGEVSVITRTLSYAKVGEVAALLKKQLSQRGEILQDERSNTLIISEVPSKIEILDKLIATLDSPNLQVSIEARFVETRTSFSDSVGIQWGYNYTADAAHGNQTTLKFPNNISIGGSQDKGFGTPLGGYAVNLPSGAPTGSTGFSFGNVANTFRLDMVLSAMQSKGLARVISAPKATTQNNKEALITQGYQIPFLLLQNNTVSVQYKNAMLELKVTPQITAKETIICAIDINNNAPDWSHLIERLGVPIITQSIRTTVMVDNGGTIVIGGVYQVENTNTKDSVPFFSKIPILGSLFKRTSNRNEQKELMIFITPRIIK